MDRERKRVRPEKGEWPYVILVVSLFFGSILLFVFEIDNFTYTTKLNAFLILFGILGMAMAIALSIYYGKGTKGIERVKVTLLFLVFVTLIFPVWAHFINRVIVLTSHTETVEVFENKFSEFKPDLGFAEEVKEFGFDFFLIYKQRIIKVQSHKPHHLIAKPGDKIEITLRRGLFGFEFVDKQKFK